MSVLLLYAAATLGIASLCGIIAERLEAADRKRQERSRRLRARIQAWRAIERLDDRRPS